MRPDNAKIVARFGKIDVFGLGSADGKPCLPDHREQRPLGPVNMKILTMDDKSPVLVDQMVVHPMQHANNGHSTPSSNQVKAEFEAKVAQALAAGGNGSIPLPAYTPPTPATQNGQGRGRGPHNTDGSSQESKLTFAAGVAPAYAHLGKRNAAEVPPPPQIKQARASMPKPVPETLLSSELIGVSPKITVRFQVPKFGVHTVDYDLVEFSECGRFLLLGAADQRTSALPAPSDEGILVYPDNLGKWLQCFDTGIRFAYGGKKIGIFSYEEVVE